MRHSFNLPPGFVPQYVTTSENFHFMLGCSFSFQCGSVMCNELFPGRGPLFITSSSHHNDWTFYFLFLQLQNSWCWEKSFSSKILLANPTCNLIKAEQLFILLYDIWDLRDFLRKLLYTRICCKDKILLVFGATSMIKVLRRNAENWASPKVAWRRAIDVINHLLLGERISRKFW